MSLGSGVYYNWSNGRRLGFRYLYNFSTYPSISSLFGTPERTSHQLQVDFIDALAFLGKKVISVGNQSSSSGILLGEVYFDQNQNGVKDTEEIRVPEIPLVMDSRQDIQTDKQGRFMMPTLATGIHTINYNMEQLPVNLTPVTNAARFKIAPGRQTQVSLGILTTPGNLSGKVTLKDGNGKPLTSENIVIVLKNTVTGQETRFTYTDQKGRFSLSDVPPGTYTLTIDSQQVKSNQLKLLTLPYSVVVPVDFENFYDRSDLNFEAIQLMQIREGT